MKFKNRQQTERKQSLSHTTNGCLPIGIQMVSMIEVKMTNIFCHSIFREWLKNVQNYILQARITVVDLLYINTLKNSNIARSCFLVSRVVEEFSWPKEAAGMHQNGMRAQNTFRGIANLCVPSSIKTQRNPARELSGIPKEQLD